MIKNNMYIHLLTYLLVTQLFLIIIPFSNVYPADTPIPYAKVTVRSGSLYKSVYADSYGIVEMDIRDNETTSIFITSYGYSLYRVLNLENISNGTIFNASLKPSNILYGYVKDPEGNPVVGALVRYAGRATYTDENGLYVVYAYISNSKYELNIEPPINPIETHPREARSSSSNIYPIGGPYSLVEYRELVGTPNPINQYNVTLNYSAVVTGYVYSFDGRPLNRGSIEYRSQDGKVVRASIEEDGSYIINSNLGIGNYTVTIYFDSLSIEVASDAAVTCLYPCDNPPMNNYSLPELVEVPVEIDEVAPGKSVRIYLRIESVDATVKRNLYILSGSQAVISLPKNLEYKVVWLAGFYREELTQFGPVIEGFDKVSLNIDGRYNQVIIRFMDPSESDKSLRMRIEGRIGDNLIYRSFFYDSLNTTILTGLDVNGSMKDINISVYAVDYYYSRNEPIVSFTLDTDMVSQFTYNMSKVDTIKIGILIKANGVVQKLDLPYRLPITFYSEGIVYNGSLKLNPNAPHFLISRNSFLSPIENIIYFSMAFPDLSPVNFSITLPNEIFKDLNLVEFDGYPLSFRVTSSNQSHTTVEITGVTYSKGDPYNTKLKIFATDVIDEFNVQNTLLIMIFTVLVILVRRLSHK